ncbi:hypothetical protein [Pseudomonas sp. RA_105y_Pfl1_P41]|uniref:hypothetical protein n=1 Tax=Pseudomonas sp. RA_105y_Pfl1_P41 TaxID=3088700 RepID=UPI0030D9A2C6
MMRPDAKVEKVYLYPKPVDFRDLDPRIDYQNPRLFGWLLKAPVRRVVFTMFSDSRGCVDILAVDRLFWKSAAWVTLSAKSSYLSAIIE